jgi:exosortase/archaeosortase family protein
MCQSLSHDRSAFGLVMTSFADTGIRKFGLRRREVLLWTLLVLLANSAVGALQVSHDLLPEQAWLLASRFDVFDAVAWAVAAWRLAKVPNAPATLGEIALALAIAVLAAAQPHAGAPLAATGAGLWLLTRSPRNADERAAGAVLLAIASHQLWSGVVFNVLSPEFVKFDAALVGRLVTWTVRGAAQHDNIITVPGGHGIAVLEGCSSFSNVSTSLLAWVALSKLARATWRWRDLAVAGAVVMTQLGLNIGRMYLLAQSQGMFTYWHDGTGAQIYAAVGSAIAVLISLLGSQWAGRAA